MKNTVIYTLAIPAALFLAFSAGYKYPRDLEIESTKPIELHYEITPEAARLLVLKFSKGLEVKP